MSHHVWTIGPRSEWVNDTPMMKKRPGWWAVPFACSVCGAHGQVMYKDGGLALPTMPEEAACPVTKKMVSPLGDCNEVIVESVHGY